MGLGWKGGAECQNIEKIFQGYIVENGSLWEHVLTELVNKDDIGNFHGGKQFKSFYTRV